MTLMQETGMGITSEVINKQWLKNNNIRLMLQR